MSRFQPNSAPGKRGIAYRGLITAVVVLFVVLVLTWALWPGFSFSAQEAAPIMHLVERGEFVHEITESGNVESGNNVEIRCEVEAKGAAGTTILEIVPEGTAVEKGQVVVKLDSSALEKELVNEQIVCNNSKATVIQAQNVLETAQISKREYLEGKYKLEKQSIENEIIVAEENHRRAVDYVKYSERLAAKGYVTALQLEADRFAVEKALNELESAKTKLLVLEEFTKEKQLRQFEADILIAEANLKAKQASHNLDLQQLALLKEQVEKCVIRSPQDGQAVYANVTRRHGTDTVIDEGERVRENQVIIRLPDPSQMQVDVKISEAKITLVEVGMPATIRLDAFPDMELAGKVEMVNELPEPTGWFSTGAKEYKTIIRVEDPPPGLRPGLTAQVKIHVERRADVLQVPVQAVFEHGGKYYCVIQEAGGFQSREVQIGSSNDEFVIIRQGLEEGQEIVLHAAAYRQKVDLPELADEARPAPTGPPLPEKPGAPLKQAPAAAAAKPAKPGKGQVDRFALMDKDGNGRIQGSEIPAQMKSHLKTLDGNGDGAIDRAEMNAVIKRFREGGGPAGQGPPGAAADGSGPGVPGAGGGRGPRSGGPP